MPGFNHVDLKSSGLLIVIMQYIVLYITLLIRLKTADYVPELKFICVMLRIQMRRRFQMAMLLMFL